jgi:alpha-L-fucosidase 2
MIDTLRLSWDSPATRWEEAVPLGNGWIGAMTFGGASGRYQLNDTTVWSRTPDGHDRCPRTAQAAILARPADTR